MIITVTLCNFLLSR